jgi:hypothetical protein
LEVFQSRVQDFLNHRAKAVNLVDKQHVVRLEIGEYRRKVTWPLEHWTGCLPQIDSHFIRNDMRKGRFAESRGTEYQDMIKCLVPFAGRLDENIHLLRYSWLTSIIGQQLWTNSPVEAAILAALLSRRQPVVFNAGH